MEAVFLVVGALGLGVLLLSLVVGEVGDLGDADGPFSVPALAALLGGAGFGGAAAAALLPDGLPDAGRTLLALAAGLVVAVPLAWAAVRLSRGLHHMSTAATLTRSSLVGTQGVVVSAVPSPGYGEVRRPGLRRAGPALR
ncbi:MAG: hypothetical protein M3Q47_14440 [Actinomycetota bacterium]|nr:hypothetical protein [Actinomycetota bacterium]